MFKLVVLSALLAAVAAEPGVLLAAPYTTYSSLLSPATTTITKSASSVVHPSPLIYSTPLSYTHFIKKRSPGVLAYNYAPTAYYGGYPYAAATLLSTPVVHSSATIVPATPLAYTTTHLIKKRSAPLLIAPTTYAAATHLYASTYATAPLISTPVVHSTPLISSPFAYSTHFIKKRSAPLLTTYVAPTSYSHQSRVDITHDFPALKLASYPTTYISQPYLY